MNYITGFLGNSFNGIAAVLILVLGSYWLWRYDLWILPKLRKTLDNLNSALDSIECDGLGTIGKINILFELEGDAFLSAVWEDFYSDYQGSALQERNIDIKNYFNPDMILVSRAERKKAESVPGILISLGIMASAAGILAGIAGIGTAGAESGQPLTNAMLKILTLGLSPFIISLIFSLLFQMIDRHFYSSAAEKASEFLNLLERRIPSSNTLGYFETLVKEQQVQTVHLMQLVNGVSRHFGDLISKDLVPAVNKSFEAAIKNLIAPPIENMKDIIKQVAESALKNQEDIAHGIADYFVNSLDASLKGKFEVFGETLSESTQSLATTKKELDALMAELALNTNNQREINSDSGIIMKSIAQYCRQILDGGASFAGTLDRMESFAVVLSEIINANREVLKQLEEQQAKLKEQSGGYFQNMNEQIGRVQENLGIQIDDIFSRYTQIAETVFNGIEDSTTRLLDGLEERSKIMMDQMSDQTANIGANTKELTDQLDFLSYRLTDSVKEFNEHLHSGVRRTFDDFDEGLGEICMRLNETIIRIRDAIEELPELLGEVKKSIAAARENEL
jgi:hypothetical protein